jgi:hypothetical protein
MKHSCSFHAIDKAIQALLRRLSAYSRYSLFRISHSSDEHSVAESSASHDDSTLGESTQSASPNEDILQQASDRAAVLIQRQFRSSFTQSSSSSMQDVPAVDMFEASDRAAALIQKQFRSSLTQSSSSSLSATAVALSDMSGVTETTYDEDFIEETKKDEEAEEPKHRSGKFMWGVAGAAMAMVAPKVLGALMGGGSPVDEDDLISGGMALQGNAAGGGGGAGAGTGAGAGGGGAGAGAGGVGAGGAGAGAGAGGGVGAGAGAATATASTAQ